jgi:tRNA threonylcarbamoyladenosine biosynthesis protein TsaE
MHFKICDVKEWPIVAENLWQLVTQSKGKVILLEGDLGTGKTTLTKYFVNHVSPESRVDSPTFNIVNSYNTKNGVIHHFDLYRLENVAEIEDIGFWDYLDDGIAILIEWPDKMANLLHAENCILVKISLSLNQCREVYISY